MHIKFLYCLSRLKITDKNKACSMKAMLCLKVLITLLAFIYLQIFNPLSPKIHIQILQTDLHTLRESGLTSKYSPFGNQFSNSHNLYS